MFAATGGVLGLMSTYTPKAIRSIYNGYNMFDLDSPGVVTKNY